MTLAHWGHAFVALKMVGRAEGTEMSETGRAALRTGSRFAPSKRCASRSVMFMNLGDSAAVHAVRPLTLFTSATNSCVTAGTSKLMDAVAAAAKLKSLNIAWKGVGGVGEREICVAGRV